VSVSVSTDIGGTFTDVVTVDERDGQVVVGKSATVAEDPIGGIAAGLEGTGVGLSEASRFLHGTTIGINALLERKGAAVGFLTTAGFRDVLTIGTGSWPPYRMTWNRPEPLVPRSRCREVKERVRADGTIEQPLDPQDVLDSVEVLLGAGAESIAVCLYNSYAQPAHERIAGEVIREHYPDLVVVLSHELSRRYREVERGSTTVAEAYLRPKMRNYFDRLNIGLDAASFEGQLLITSSDGGAMGVNQARDRALRTLVSGCASGVSGAASIASSNGWPDVLTIDMGGTSFDAAVIRAGTPNVIQSAELAGLRFLIPMIDLATIGAGGGSIASVDSAGGLNVGPGSAGAVPGPACYARGGELPTFTDAALVSGLLPEELLSGGMDLRKDLAEQAISRHVSDPLGLSLTDAAAGITAVVEARMAQTLEELTVGQGLDPRDFTVMAYGGGGPLVATRLAAEIGATRAVIPVHPGVFSALGMQTLDVVHDFSRTWISGLSETDPATIAGFFDQLCAEAQAVLEAESVDRELIQLHRSVELRYEGQEHALLIPSLEVQGGDLGVSVTKRLAKALDRAHQATFGFTIEGDAEIVGFQVRAIGQLPKASFASRTSAGADASAAMTGSREVHDRSSGTAAWPVYRRDLLEPGNRLKGPAVVEELTATTVVSPGFDLEVHHEGHLVLTSDGSAP
jgi:N-methylhydantoinase A